MHGRPQVPSDSDQDGDLNPISDLVPEGETAESPPSDASQDDEAASEIAGEVVRMLGVSWTGRLPRPADLQEYDNIVPGSAADLVQELLQESRLAERSIDLDRDVSTRVQNLMDDRFELEKSESESDREFRTVVFNWLKPLFYLPLVLVFVIIMWAPLGNWAKVAAVSIVVVASVAPLCIVLLRGRMSSNERDALVAIVPQVVAEVTAAIRTKPLSGGESPSGDSSKKPAPSDATIRTISPQSPSDDRHGS